MNEEEDRRRLKEKLKEALESARRNHQLSDDSEGQVLRETDMRAGSGADLSARRFARRSKMRYSVARSDFRAVSRFGNLSSGNGVAGSGEERPGAEGHALPSRALKRRC